MLSWDISWARRLYATEQIRGRKLGNDAAAHTEEKGGEVEVEVEAGAEVEVEAEQIGSNTNHPMI